VIVKKKSKIFQKIVAPRQRHRVRRRPVAKSPGRKEGQTVVVRAKCKGRGRFGGETRSKGRRDQKKISRVNRGDANSEGGDRVKGKG